MSGGRLAEIRLWLSLGDGTEAVPGERPILSDVSVNLESGDRLVRTTGSGGLASFDSVAEARLELDRLVVRELLGLDEASHRRVYEGTLELVRQRIEKAESVRVIPDTRLLIRINNILEAVSFDCPIACSRITLLRRILRSNGVNSPDFGSPSPLDRYPGINRQEINENIRILNPWSGANFLSLDPYFDGERWISRSLVSSNPH